MDINIENTEDLKYVDKTDLIETPSLELANKYIKDFKYDEENKLEDSCIKNLFSQFNMNNDIDQVIVKVTVLNEFYHTQILNKNLITIAKHIVSQNIDKDLNEGSPEAVNKIINVSNMKKKPYSFATKYCHWHNPDKYPIVDSYVKGILYYLNKREKFYKDLFVQKDLKNYEKFCDIYDTFIEKYGLKKLTYKEVDMYLWQYGKVLDEKLNKYGKSIRIY